MIDIFLQILSVIGILLLVILAALLAVILLVLFFPVSYRISGEKIPEEELAFKVRANWLFCMLRLRFAYPEPGKMTVKFLWFTLFDSKTVAAPDRETEEKSNPEAVQESPTGSGSEGNGTVRAVDGGKAAEKEESRQEKAVEENTGQEEGLQEKAVEENTGQEENRQEKDETEGLSRISKIFTKIKYTIRSIYDKIIKIWQNISYYREFLNEEDTRTLLSHVMLRLRKILKSLRPRKLKAEILFGTGAPDTTGYAFGVYGMLMPLLGPSVTVIPDFQRAVFKGTFQASGYTTLFVLLWQVLRVVTDRRLKKFLFKLKRHGTEPERDTGVEKSKNEGHKHENRKQR